MTPTPERTPYAAMGKWVAGTLLLLLSLLAVGLILFLLVLTGKAIWWAISPPHYNASAKPVAVTVDREPVPPHRVIPRASRTRPTQSPVVPIVAPRSSSRGQTQKADASDIGWPWDALVRCEAPDRGWRYGAPGVGIDPGYYFEGGPNFEHSTWVSFGGREFAEHAWDATPHEQIIVAKRVLAAQGWGAWPRCSRKLGLR